MNERVTPYKRVIVYCSPHEHLALKKMLAEKYNGMYISSYLREFIQQALEAYEQEKQP